MPVVYDGFWIHNGKDERVNARHRNKTQTNMAFFDQSARTVRTAEIPSVQDKNSGEIRWRWTRDGGEAQPQ
jgi:prepilin-type processing-associated H-X9-DG protein